jgi:23S rRNA pseudouridine1911/1915/1917 synthase
MSVPDEDNIGKRAVTHYKVVEDYGYVSLIECQLETGRTHQIRAHMKYIGHPIFNDIRYGGDKILKGTIFNKYKQFVENCFKVLPRQALHAKTLGFVHPIKNKKMVFEIEVPDDFNSCLEKWKKYSKNN